MNGPRPERIPLLDENSRAYSPAYKDAAVRACFDQDLGGVACELCKNVMTTRAKIRKMHADHIVPFSRGGRTNWENLQLLCANCNLTKSANVYDSAGE